MKYIRKTKNGQITYCPCHNTFHLEFGNLFFTLNSEELKGFTSYINTIDYSFYLKLNREVCNKRKLLININCNNAYFCLYVNEFLELKELLGLNKKSEILKNSDVIENAMNFN